MNVKIYENLIKITMIINFKSLNGTATNNTSDSGKLVSKLIIN